MNKYEKNLMFNVTVMKIIYCIIIFVNLLVPIKKDVYFILSPLQIIIVIVWLFGLLGGMGFFDQRTPLLPVGLLRFIEILDYGILRSNYMNWWSFAIFVVLDIIFTTFLFFDKANYSYVKEASTDGRP